MADTGANNKSAEGTLGRAKRAAKKWWALRVVRRFALSALVRSTGNFSDVTWLGKPIWQNPADAWALQEALIDLNVDLVIECGTNRGGSAFFMATIFDILGRGHIITMDIERLADFEHPRIEFLVSSSTEPATVEYVHRRVKELDARKVLVMLDSDHSEAHVFNELKVYADLIAVGGYIFVQDGVIDELRIFRKARPGPLQAIRHFVREDGRFVIDEQRSNRFLFNHSPLGWLKRIR